MTRLKGRDYIESFLKIRTKDGELVTLKLNAPQRRLYAAAHRLWAEGKPVRIIILKARQMGFSTLTEALIFFLTATRFNSESMIVAHTEEATAKLFRMSQRFYDELPEALKPMRRASNAQEIVFDRPPRTKGRRRGLGSSIRCATAGGSGIGRGYTLQCLHLSEFAFWPGNKRETYVGLMQAVPDKPGTVVIIESTANGYDEFKTMWDAAVEAERNGTDGFLPIFFAWHEMEEYRRTPLPGFERTAEEQELAETYGLDDEQLAWRRWCIATQCGGDIDLFHQEYPACPDEAFISTGRCVFDKASLITRRERVRALKWERGRFRVTRDYAGKIASFEWETDEKGPIRLLKRPEAGAPYVIGGDTAGTGSDYFVGQVLDNRTGEQVAVLHHRMGERMYAEQLYCLGKFYNDALIGIETNYSTYPEMCLEDMGYRHLYVRERYDTYTGATAQAFGFETTSRTRPVIIDGLRDVARRELGLINDYDTLGEMLVFVYDENWRPAAEEGEHDDLVMALAIAHAIRGQQRRESEENAVYAEWTESMKEDFENASKEEREYLLKKWGRPKNL